MGEPKTITAVCKDCGASIMAMEDPETGWLLILDGVPTTVSEIADSDSEPVMNYAEHRCRVKKLENACGKAALNLGILHSKVEGSDREWLDQITRKLINAAEGRDEQKGEAGE